MTANAVAWNANITKVMEAEKWIYKRYSSMANTLLFCASIKLNEKTKLLEMEDKDIPELGDSIENTDCGSHYGQ